MRPPSRPGPCCAKEGLPPCLGGTCSHCPECGDHRFAAADGRCLTCHPVIGGLAAKPKPKPRGRATGAEESSHSRSLEGTLLEHAPPLEPVAATPAPTVALPTEADLVRGRVLGCLECGAFEDTKGGDGVRCACGSWATKRGSAVMAHRMFGTPLPPGVVMPEPKVSEGGEHHATGPGKPVEDVVQGDGDAPTAVPSPPPVRIRSVEDFRAEFGDKPDIDALLEQVPAIEFDLVPALEFEPVPPADGVPGPEFDDWTVEGAGDPPAREWVLCPGGCNVLKDSTKLDAFCRACSDRDAARVGEDRPGITGNSSPRTSVAAAMTLPTGKRRVQVLTVLARHGAHGRTAEELETETGLGGSTIRPRLLELERDGFVERTEATRPTRSGMAAVVWGATARGRDAADRLNGRPAGMP